MIMINPNPVLQSRSSPYSNRTSIKKFGNGGGFNARYDPTFDKSNTSLVYSIQLETSYNNDNRLLYLVNGTYGFFFRLFNADVTDNIQYNIYTSEIDVTEETINTLADVDWHIDGTERDVVTENWDSNPLENAKITSRVTAIMIELKADVAKSYTIEGVVSAV